jgi:uncharacterized membrane-anchored protein YjiN (DUF445 family)
MLMRGLTLSVRFWKPHLGEERSSKRCLGGFDWNVGKLKLTDSQKKRYDEIKSKIKARAEVVNREREEIIERVRDELNKENPDVEGIIVYLKEASRNKPDLMAEWLDYFKEFYDILDDDQKARLSRMIKETLLPIKSFI